MFWRTSCFYKISCFESHISKIIIIIFMFEHHDSKTFYVSNVTFLKHFMFWTSHVSINFIRFECHISWIFQVLNVIKHYVPEINFFHVLNYFMLWMSHFSNTSCFERHVSQTFQVLNVTFLKQFIFKHYVFETYHVLNVTYL